MTLRTTATLAAGLVSALLALAALRGLPFGTVLFWFSPFPLFAAGLAFGWPAAAQAVMAGALVAAVSGGVPGTIAWVLLFAMPAVLLLRLALPATPGAPLALAVPFAMLALWPAAMLLAAELAFAGQPGGFSGVLHAVVEQALTRMGAPSEVGGEDFAAMMVRIKPLAFALWFGVVMAMNASIAQRMVERRGLLIAAPARWSMALLPGWYWKLAAGVVVAALVVPGGAGFAVRSAAMMLAVPLALQGLAVVHVVSQGRPGRPLMLGPLYVALVLFTVPVGVGLAGLGVAEHFLKLRGGPPRPGTGLTPPED
ncbi:hypothetical protein [Elioraea sp.]|jgi:hypothetical protein|uniref:hypothetical protein n=1 Tax=Elioraea sp. TaxID=2185103 RepID=UPI003F6FA6D5